MIPKFKKTLHNILSDGLARLPFSFLSKSYNLKLILPLYHTISDNELLHVKHTFPYRNVKQFESDLDFFQKHFNPIQPEELLNKITLKERFDERSFLLTFDDGYRESIEIIAPILERRSLPAIFFLNSAFIDNKELFYRHKASILVENINNLPKSEVIIKLKEIVNNSNTQIDEIKRIILKVHYQNRHLLDKIADLLNIDFNNYLKDNQPYLNSGDVKSLIDKGFFIGAHSVDHPLFKDITLNDQLAQVRNCFNYLQESFFISDNYFAFPHTDYGVNFDFFQETHFNKEIDLSFGTSNFSIGHCENNIQRQLMEREDMKAEVIYKKLISRELISGSKSIF